MPSLPVLRDVGRSHVRVCRCRPWAWFLVGVCAFWLPQSARADVDDDYNLALQFYRQERWEQAASQLRSFLEQAAEDHGKVPLAKLYLGQTLVHQRNFEQARPVFRDFVKSYPQQEDLPLAMYRVAECSYFVDDFAAARNELNAFLQKVPADHPLAEWALQYLGETQLQLEDYTAARQAFEKGIDQFPRGRLNSEMQFGLARAFDGLKQPDEARQIYRALADGNGPRAADAQFNLAAQLFDGKDYAQAAKLFEATATKFSDQKVAPLATLNAGYSYYHLGEYPQAMQMFAKVRDDARHGPDAEYWTGLSLKSLEKWDEAATTLLKQFEKDEQQPLAESLLFHAADARLGARNYLEAQRLFRDVHRRWPQGEMADDSLHLATEAAILAGDFEAAGEFDAQFSREFPESGLRLPQDLLSGRLLLAEGDRLAEANGDQAKQLYRKAVESFTRVLGQSQIDETQSLARLQLARAWDRLANHQQVLATLKPLVDSASAPDASEEALAALAMQSTALLSLQRYDESLAAATEFLSRQPSGPEVAEALANVCLANAHLRRWPAIKEPLARLRSAGTDRLTDRVSYEVAEAAYDDRQWEIAETYYQQLVDEGDAGEFYRPSISGLAYSLHEQGQALQKQIEDADSADVGLLNRTIGRFDAATRWFTRLAQLSGEQDERVIQSDALYMKGLSQRLARRLPDATATFMSTAQEFGLPAEAPEADEATVKAGYNAYRSAKEAARTYQQLQDTMSADAAYQIAFDQLQRQPAAKRGGLGSLVYEWALLHYNAGDVKRAEELFKQFIDVEPQNEWADDARLLLAEGLYFDQQDAAARDAFQALVTDEATDDFVRERSLVFLMDVAARLEDWKLVTSTASSLLEQYPQGDHRQEARYRQGEAALQLEDFASAKTIFAELAAAQDDQSLAAQVWYPGIWLMLAETHLRLKEYEQVAQVAREFADLHPDSPLAYHLDDVQGRAHQKQARFDEARAAFQSVIDSPHGKGTETAAKAQLFIAESYLIQKNYQKAFEEYYRVLLYGFPQWQSAALFQAGQCEEKLKQWQGAAKSYRQLLEDFPDSDYADEAQQRLQDLEQRFPETVGR